MSKRKTSKPSGFGCGDARLFEKLAQIFKKGAKSCGDAYKENSEPAATTFVLIGIVMDSVSKELLKEAEKRDDAWNKN